MTHEVRYPANRPDTRFLAVLAIGALLASGCTKAQPPARVVVDSGSTASADSLVDTTGLYYPEKSGDSTNKLLAAPGNWDDTPGRKWTGTLNCSTASACDNHPTVAFRIRPRHNAHTVNHRRVLDGEDEARWIAEITNTDGVRYGPWNIGPNETVYLYVGLLGTGKRRLAIYRLDPTDGKGTLLATARAAALCDMAGPPHTYSRVEVFKPAHCRNRTDMQMLYGSPYVASGALKPSVAKLASYSAVTAVAQALDGLWISCTGGCCEGTDFQ